LLIGDFKIKINIKVLRGGDQASSLTERLILMAISQDLIHKMEVNNGKTQNPFIGSA
jgi:hypothetical protein